ncbi:MAG: hypothetical protein U0169_10190 [Polyangiaceae bacterium]
MRALSLAWVPCLLASTVLVAACSGSSHGELFDESALAASDEDAGRPRPGATEGDDGTSEGETPSVDPSLKSGPAGGSDAGSTTPVVDSGTTKPVDASVPDTSTPVDSGNPPGIDAGTTPVDSGSTGPKTAICYDGEALKDSYKECGSNQDCDTTTHTVDCCGSMVVVAYARAKTSDVLQCEIDSARLNVNPTCSCTAKPTRAEDGNTVMPGVNVERYCQRSQQGQRGLCMTRKRN